MKVLRFIVTISGLIVVLALDHELDIPNVDLIVGGSNAAPGQIPYQVGLRYKNNNKHFCGGVIIDKMWIVTCAHCLYNGKDRASGIYKVDSFRAAVGTINIDSGIYYDLAEIIIHPKKDIALLKTKVEIVFTKKQTMSIPMNAKGLPKPDSVVTASGWGYTQVNIISRIINRTITFNVLNFIYQNGGPLSNILQFIQARIVADSECNDGPAYFCMRQFKTGNGTCEGDSGGPIVFKSKLYGIAQAVSKGCNYIDYNVNIAYFQSWINSYIKPKTMLL